MSPAKKSMGRRTALDMLTRCHQRLDGVLPELQEALVDGDGEVAAECMAFLRGPLMRHFVDEEKSVFPKLGAAHRELTSRLTKEHREHEASIERLQHLIDDGQFSQALALARTFAEELEGHSAVEEEELWPAIARLGDQALEEARQEMRSRRPNKGRRHQRR